MNPYFPAFPSCGDENTRRPEVIPYPGLVKILRDRSIGQSASAPVVNTALKF
jgi:hypothetical protein